IREHAHGALNGLRQWSAQPVVIHPPTLRAIGVRLEPARRWVHSFLQFCDLGAAAFELVAPDAQVDHAAEHPVRQIADEGCEPVLDGADHSHGVITYRQLLANSYTARS